MVGGSTTLDCRDMRKSPKPDWYRPDRRRGRRALLAVIVWLPLVLPLLVALAALAYFSWVASALDGSWW